MDYQLSRGAAELLRRLTFLSQQRGFAFPSRQYLAAKMQCSVPTIDRYTRELRKSGALKTKKRQHMTAKYEIQNYQNDSSGNSSGDSSASPYLLSPEQERVNPLEQHHHDDVALAYESIRKAAGFERLSEGDRRFVAGQRKAGISEEQIVAGIVLGRSRKMTSGAAEPIRSLRYFAATIQEAPTVSAAYIRHCELWIERKAGGR